MRNLIIHPKDTSTDFLKPSYATISNKTVINGGISKNELRNLIKKHDRIIMLGHGTPIGLLSVGQFPDAGSYVIDYSYFDLRSSKSENIFIWCYANQFVERNRLVGFYSGMFISEFGEAFSNGYYISNTKLIDESNELFSSVVAKYINEPLEILHRNVIREYGILAKSNPIAQFNMERLFVSAKNREWVKFI